jgi:RimJ/RimL family protein N-acetyltransferase
MVDSEAARAADELLSARLRLRRWRPEDDRPVATISADPEVSRYLNHAAGPYVERFERHWREHGFGLWALERLDADGCIGFVGIAHPGFLPAVAHRIEIGWRLARAQWGQGFATEAALAARDHVRERLGVRDLIAIIHPENRRSQRVATKLGMSVSTHVYNEALGIPVEIWSE